MKYKGSLYGKVGKRYVLFEANTEKIDEVDRLLCKAKKLLRKIQRYGYSGYVYSACEAVTHQDLESFLKARREVSVRKRLVCHVCYEDKMCTCSMQALEPDEECPIHGAGPHLPRCKKCGRFIKRPNMEICVTEESEACDDTHNAF